MVKRTADQLLDLQNDNLMDEYNKLGNRLKTSSILQKEEKMNTNIDGSNLQFSKTGDSTIASVFGDPLVGSNETTMKNCISPWPFNNDPSLNWPIIVTSTGTNISTHSSDLNIRKVKNGFVVKKYSEEFVFEGIDSLVKFIKNTFKETSESK